MPLHRSPKMEREIRRLRAKGYSFRQIESPWVSWRLQTLERLETWETHKRGTRLS